MSISLVERLSADEAQIHLVEKARKEKGILARYKGRISQCDMKNKNERVYEVPLWHNVLESGEFKKGLNDRTILGEPDHPETRTDPCIREASHFLTEMRYNPNDKWVTGEIALYDNTLGRLVHTMLEAGTKLGWSTRGDGDLIEDEDQGFTRVDPETFEFKGVDFVLNPSFASAGPMNESHQKRIRTALMEGVEKKVVDDELKKSVEKLIGVKARNKVKEAFDAVPQKDPFALMELLRLVAIEEPTGVKVTKENKDLFGQLRGYGLVQYDNIRDSYSLTQKGKKKLSDLGITYESVEEPKKESKEGQVKEQGEGLTVDVLGVGEIVANKTAGDEWEIDLSKIQSVVYGPHQDQLSDLIEGLQELEGKIMGARIRRGEESTKESSKDGSLTALEKVLTELRNANFRAGDFEDKLEESGMKLETLQKENEQLKKRLKELEKAAKDTSTAVKLKSMLKEVQTKLKEKIAELMQIEEERDQLKAKLERSVRILSELKNKLLEDRKNLKKEAEEIRKELKTQEEQFEKDKLEAHRSQKMEGVKLSDTHKRLLERATTSQEVDDVIELHQEAMRNAYPDLPCIRTKEARQKVLEELDSIDRADRSDHEAEDTKGLAESQIQ